MKASKSSKTSGPSSVGLALSLPSASLAMAGSYHGPRGDYVPMRCAASIAAAVAVGALLAAPAYAAAPKGGDAEQALRTGRYEQARRIACGSGRGRGSA